MRLNGYVTATLLTASIVAAGCSGDEAPSSAKKSQYGGGVTPVSMNNDTKLAIGSKLPVAEPVGPASFSDGETAYKAGNYSEATRIFKQYATENSGNAWGHFMLGLSTWKNGEPDSAEAAFGEALRIDPNHIKSYLNLSRVLIDQKRFDEAVEKLTKAAELDPKSAEVHRLLGRAYAAQGNTEDAKDAYRAALALDDKDAWSMNNLGLLFIEQGRFAEALLPLSKAVELRNDVAIFHNNLGMALEHTGRFKAAGAEYNSALTADSGYGKAKQNLARVEAVKVTSEEPFDLSATAKHFVDTTWPEAEKPAIVVEKPAEAVEKPAATVEKSAASVEKVEKVEKKVE